MKISISFVSVIFLGTLTLIGCDDGFDIRGGEGVKKDGNDAEEGADEGSSDGTGSDSRENAGRGGNTGGNTSDGSGDSGRDAPADGNASDQREPKDCDTQWRERVASTRIGQIQVHDIHEVTTSTGEVDRTVRARSREEVLAATDEAIVTATRWEYFEPDLGVVEGDGGLTKEHFMLTCSPLVGDPEADPEGLTRAGVTVLEDRAASITVQAGTFETRYQKIHVDSDDGRSSEVMGEHWTIDDELIVVKEKSRVTSVYDGVTAERVTERELVEYVAGVSASMGTVVTARTALLTAWQGSLNMTLYRCQVRCE